MLFVVGVVAPAGVLGNGGALAFVRGPTACFRGGTYETAGGRVVGETCRRTASSLGLIFGRFEVLEMSTSRSSETSASGRLVRLVGGL